MTSKLDRFLQRSNQMGEEIQSLQNKTPPLEGSSNNKHWQPRFEMYHHHDSLFIDVELPGVPPGAIEVESRPDMVLVRGEKPGFANLPEREEIVSSREYGPFATQFAVPPGFALDRLEQRLENGVLHLRIHLTEAQARVDAR